MRSVLPGAAEEVGPVLDGRAGGVDCDPPKKSSPSRLSPGRVCLGGAAGPLGRPALTIAGSVVLGLAGATPKGSPNKSISCGLALGAGGTTAAAPPPLSVCDALLALSCTTFNGRSSSSTPPSNVAGSGIGPSITHRFPSYFVRMKFSILASFGTCPSASLCSQYLFALALPHRIIFANCSSVQESRSTDLTRLTCVPRPRWMPEQRMQKKTPRFHEAQRGCLLRLQSAQDLLDSSLTSCLSVARLRSAASAAAVVVARRRDMEGGWGWGSLYICVCV